MKDDLLEISQTVVSSLFDFLHEEVRWKETTGKGYVPEVEIKMPFLLYDNNNLRLRIRRIGNKFILHDNGWMYQYLLDYGIDISKLKQKSPYWHYVESLKQRNGFVIDKNYGLMLLSFTEINSKQIYTFIDALVSISFLALSKSVGMKPFTPRDRIQYDKLRELLAREFEDVEINPQIKLPEINWPNQWGMMLTKDISGPVAVQFLGGYNWQKIGVNLMVTNSVLEAEQRFLNLDREDCIVVYDGPPEYYEPAKNALALLSNGRNQGEGYPMTQLEDSDKLIKLIASRFLKKASLESTKSKVINRRIDYKYRGTMEDLPTLEKILQENDLSLERAHILRDDVAFEIILELYSKGVVKNDSMISFFGSSGLRSFTELYAKGLITVDKDQTRLSEEGYILARKIEAHLSEPIAKNY